MWEVYLIYASAMFGVLNRMDQLFTTHFDMEQFFLPSWCASNTTRIRKSNSYQPPFSMTLLITMDSFFLFDRVLFGNVGCVAFLCVRTGARICVSVPSCLRPNRQSLQIAWDAFHFSRHFSFLLCFSIQLFFIRSKNFCEITFEWMPCQPSENVAYWLGNRARPQPSSTAG